MPDADSSDIPGLERAAILLMSLGEKDAADVLRHMEPKEVQRLGVAMASLTHVNKNKAGQVLHEFISSAENETSLGIGSQEYIRNMLVNALGQDKAAGLIDRILNGTNTTGLETLKWMDARAVAELIRLEHPQIIAIVMSYLESEQSAEVLKLLPDTARSDVLMRIASLDGIQPSAMKELNDILERQFSGNTNVSSSNVGGVKTAADILNFMDSDTESAIIETIKQSDEELATQIEDLMLVFEDLIKVDDKGIQAILKEISSDSLVIAMKGSSEGIKEKFFKNMSKRAAEMLRDDLEVKGPVRVSEVEVSQKEILAVARRLSESGEIMLGSGGGDDYV